MEEYLNKVICGESRAVMESMPDGCIDLTVTSPPYDNLRNYNGYSFDFKGIANQLLRITKEGGVVVWIVGDATVNGSETGTSFKQALYFKEIGFNLHDTMIYERTAAYPASEKSVRYTQTFEYMFVLSKGKPKSINLIRDRKNKWGGMTSFGTQSERCKDGKLKKRRKIFVSEVGFRFNIWKYATGKGMSTKDEIAFSHPAIFPEKLAEDHILSWSNEGDTVLDPMCGSGTTCKIARKNGRNFIGLDVSHEYCDIANKRLSQQPLF
jgi:site-specific DNA-methyltransferase (adenine-specific)